MNGNKICLMHTKQAFPPNQSSCPAKLGPTCCGAKEQDVCNSNHSVKGAPLYYTIHDSKCNIKV